MTGSARAIQLSSNDKNLHSGPAAILPVGEARFLQIEVAFDPPPGLVGDLAVAQQRVDELALRRDQFPRQFGAVAETSCRSGSSVSGSWLARVSCRARNSLTTSSDNSRSSVMASSDFSAASERLAPRRDFRFVLGEMLVAAGLRDAEPSHHRRQRQARARPA